MTTESTSIIDTSDCNQNDKVYLILGEEKNNATTTHSATTSSVLVKVEDAIAVQQQVEEENEASSTAVIPHQKVSEEDAWKKNKRKSVCDPDYATPSKEGASFGGGGGGSGSGLLFNKSVKRRLDFQSVSIITHQNDHDYSSNEKEPPTKTHPHPHHHHHKKKKKHRNKQGGGGEAIGEQGTTGDIGKDSGKTLGDVVGPTSTTSDNKENKAGGGPPRKIAQLVVWTKNPPGTSSTTATVSASASKKPLQESRGALQNQQKSTSKLLKKNSEEKEEESTSEEVLLNTCECEEVTAPPESDLFIVQYPVRPFSDQGKGKGKPFRRLNSYNDPIVIKKTPPAPPPSARRRGGGGQKRKRGSLVDGNTGGGPSKEKPVGGGGGLVVHLPPQQPIAAALQQEGVLVGVSGGGGEIPIYLEPGQEHQYAALFQQILLQNHYYTVPQGVGVGGEVFLHHHHPQGIVGEAIIPESSGGGQQVIKQEAELKSDHPPVILRQAARENQESMGPVPPGVGGGVGEMGGGEYNIFDLPERFTVTTTSGEVTQNEFDLLIQNVVHEEMVMEAGGGQVLGEGEMAGDFAGEQEGARKRMRLDYDGHVNANGQSPASMGMMERCNNGEGGVPHGGGEVDDGYGQGGCGGPDESGKPRCTYTELIEKALTESGGLTVSEIYNWISERFPYYRQDDDRWKNSVRHNLSINPYFKKGEKARSGAGHLWTISEESKALRPSPHQQMVSWNEYQRRKNGCDEDDILLSMDHGTETDRAVASILGMYRNECNKAAEKEKGGNGGNSNTTLQESERLSDPLEESSAVTPPTDASAACVQIESTPVAHPPVEEDSSCSTTTAAATFGLEGQFTVDLSGITIPEGGTINFEELVSNGRLIYIQTTAATEPSAAVADPEANKENEQQAGGSGGQPQNQPQLLSLNSDNQILAELTGSLPTSSQANGGSNGSLAGGMSSEEAHRFSQSFYTDALGSLVADFGGFGSGAKGENNGGGLLMQSSSVFGGVNNEGYSSSCPTSTTVVPITSISCTSSSTSCELTMVPPAEVVAPTTTADHNHRQHHQHHQDLNFLDHQVLHPLSTYEVLSSSSSGCQQAQLPPSSLQLIGDSAALYESKELGLSYTTNYQQNAETLSSSSSADNHNHHTHQNHQDLLQ